MIETPEIDKEIEEYALHCGVPFVETWAKCWLSRERYLGSSQDAVFEAAMAAECADGEKAAMARAAIPVAAKAMAALVFDMQEKQRAKDRGVAAANIALSEAMDAAGVIPSIKPEKEEDQTTKTTTTEKTDEAHTIATVECNEMIYALHLQQDLDVKQAFQHLWQAFREGENTNDHIAKAHLSLSKSLRRRNVLS